MGPGSVHVERYGQGGLPIVLLHGFGTCTFLWRAVAPALAAARHTVFAIDLLGHGESDRPLEADFGVAAQSEYLDRALTVLRVARALVVGVDIGGAVALRLAATRPDRVAGLVLVNAVAFDDVPGEDVRTLQRNTARFVFRLGRGVFGAAPLLAPLLRGSVARPEHMPEKLVARYLAPFVGSEGVPHLLDLARSLRVEEVDEIDVGAITAPTLIVWGEADPWLDRSIPGQLLRTIQGSRLERFPNVGRLVPEEAPYALAATIAAHAARVGIEAPAPSPDDMAEARAAAVAPAAAADGDRRRADRGGADRRQSDD
ncbi:oxidoreductase [Gemmatimonadetes bacterium T265]|nr:oxidoreductase [Gemmatimonadetes bacterium T265]